MYNRLKILHGDFHNYSGKRQRKPLLDTLPPAYHQPLPINPSCMPSIQSPSVVLGNKANNVSTACGYFHSFLDSAQTRLLQQHPMRGSFASAFNQEEQQARRWSCEVIPITL